MCTRHNYADVYPNPLLRVSLTVFCTYFPVVGRLIDNDSELITCFCIYLYNISSYSSLIPLYTTLSGA